MSTRGVAMKEKAKRRVVRIEAGASQPAMQHGMNSPKTEGILIYQSNCSIGYTLGTSVYAFHLQIIFL